MRTQLLALGLTALALAPLPGCEGPPPPPGTTNVVIVVVDTLRADHADSRAGRANTPAVDALAADGVRFPLAFAHAPMTLPAHTSLFASRAPSETGVVNNGQRVPLELPLLAEWLAERGYERGAAVSLGTLWPLSAGEGLDRGFATFDVGSFELARADEVNARVGDLLDGLAGPSAGVRPFLLLAHYSDPHEPYNSHGASAKTARVLLDDALIADVISSEWSHRRYDLNLGAGEHTVEVRADDLLKVRRLTVTGPDGPLEVTFDEGRPLERVERLRARFTVPERGLRDGVLDLWLHDVPARGELAARYRAEAEYADRAVGELLDALRARGLYDDALIVFTSDHGEALGEHGTIGHVRTLFDELLHVPLVIKPPRSHPGTKRLRRASSGLARHIDVVPTVLELIGLPALPGQRGTSLLTREDRVHAAETHRPEAPRDLFALRDRRKKLVYEPEADRFRLYDLDRDPGELEDVFDRDTTTTREWQTLLRELAARGAGSGLDRSQLDAETRARLESLGY